jgi:hypothetical protein
VSLGWPPNGTIVSDVSDSRFRAECFMEEFTVSLTEEAENIGLDSDEDMDSCVPGSQVELDTEHSD